MRRFAEMRNIHVWYARLDLSDIRTQLGARISGKQVKRLESSVGSVHTKDSIRALAKLCRTVDGELRIVGDPPLVTPIEDVLPGAEAAHLDDVVRRMIGTYRQTLPQDRRHLLESYRYVHAARKVVGVGSVGTRAWILLLAGRDDADPLFLQFKEAQASVLEPFLGRSRHSQHGQRVVDGQRMMQAASDVLLGWERVSTIDGEERDFYIRQLWDAKGSADIELLDRAGSRPTPGSAAGRSREPTRARATGSRSPPISAQATPSTAPWRRSQRPTRTRTNGTTRRMGLPAVVLPDAPDLAVDVCAPALLLPITDRGSGFSSVRELLDEEEGVAPPGLAPARRRSRRTGSRADGSGLRFCALEVEAAVPVSSDLLLEGQGTCGSLDDREGRGAGSPKAIVNAWLSEAIAQPSRTPEG